MVHSGHETVSVGEDASVHGRMVEIGIVGPTPTNGCRRATWSTRVGRCTSSCPRYGRGSTRSSSTVWPCEATGPVPGSSHLRWRATCSSKCSGRSTALPRPSSSHFPTPSPAQRGRPAELPFDEVGLCTDYSLYAGNEFWAPGRARVGDANRNPYMRTCILTPRYSATPLESDQDASELEAREERTIMETQTEEELQALRIAVNAMFLRLPVEDQSAVLHDLKVQMSLAAERASDPRQTTVATPSAPIA